MQSELDRKILSHFSQLITDHKKEIIEKFLALRTRHITVVLEDIYQSQNASAVIRTCECMGLQDVHIVENLSKYHLNTRVLKGADKWMDLYRYKEKKTNNTKECFQKLRDEGYKILVTDPSPDGVSIHEIDPIKNKLAIVFGNELRGTSPYAIEHGDQKVKIPMYGFTESLNISVSAAICLNSLIAKLRLGSENFGLSREEKEVIRLIWYRKVVKRSDIIEREFLRTIE
jgi:tRNA (guanosine-2'-O-)-methyltransferase